MECHDADAQGAGHVSLTLSLCYQCLSLRKLGHDICLRVALPFAHLMPPKNCILQSSIRMLAKTCWPIVAIGMGIIMSIPAWSLGAGSAVTNYQLPDLKAKGDAAQ
jgi:hypothetical protein